MKNGARDEATNQPVSLNNEVNLFAAVFDGTAAAPTSGAAANNASIIVPDDYIPSSGQKQNTKPFSPVNMKKMAKKDTIGTTSAHESPIPAPTNASARFTLLEVPNSPYPLKNSSFHDTSTTTKKLRKIQNCNLW